jgi:hypothetical protein
MTQPSSISQKRAQAMRGLLGSIGSGIQHSRTVIQALKAERESDHSMKTKLNGIAVHQLESLKLELIRAEQALQVLNEHFRNYPKPTKTKWERLEAKYDSQQEKS